MFKQLKYLAGETLLRWGFELTAADFSDEALCKWAAFVRQRTMDISLRSRAARGVSS